MNREAPPTAIGSARGFRWWRATGAYLRSPWRGGERWRPGLNDARCLWRRRLMRWEPHPSAPHRVVPERACRCGFYAIHDVPDGFRGRRRYSSLPWYFDLDISGGAHGLVFGVVEGSGHMIVGERGWRAARARVNALFVGPSRQISPELAAVAQRYGVAVYRNLDAMVQEWATEPLPQAPIAPLDAR